MLELVTRETETPDAGHTPSTPDELLPRVAQGDQAAFAELYDQTAPRVLGLVKRLLKDHAQSEEVTQEVFLEIWQNATRFDSTRGSAASWMLTMAHRRAVDRIRASQAGRDRDLKIGVRDLETDYDSVTESVEIRIEHERVERALGRLTELQRQAVKLAYYGGLSHSEVAKLLDVPIGTVKTRLRDGMIRLRDEMGVAS
ncbi:MULTISPECIES: sigma-70 family RNA polymerase sigma factor [unclassified Frigoribacterium]|uniref:sigma-70 family RNA polymerase sigma factor n=1 Tax=unclassified Frigoribacterium TaxID=2627005 RepID=UPI0006FC0514|nr:MULTISPECIES: sigma-70 family RNA polymerase sigma factor [unclassified Frigoribacterium]KQO47800.1 RNA polymerase subunit sigma [Frigoribacterium sp. Leaf254]KQT39893.1 RNA polymerase subunit sigma [Frigoribacterium sp. Leaf415]